VLISGVLVGVALALVLGREIRPDKCKSPRKPRVPTRVLLGKV
jgi:hypothetical protein